MSVNGSISTELGYPRHVRFTPDSDRRTDIAGGPFRAKCGSRGLFDHIVGAGEQRRRKGEAKRFCRLEIDHQFKLCWQLDWKVGGLCSLQDLGDHAAGLAE